MTTTLTRQVYTGFNYAELVEVLERWALAVSETPAGLLNAGQLADAAAGFEDTLSNLDPNNPCDRDVLTADEHASEAGLCPDSHDHLMVECHKHGCPNYLDDLSDLAPWGTPAGRLGMWEK